MLKNTKAAIAFKYDVDGTTEQNDQKQNSGAKRGQSSSDDDSEGDESDDNEALLELLERQGKMKSRLIDSVFASECILYRYYIEYYRFDAIGAERIEQD